MEDDDEVCDQCMGTGECDCCDGEDEECPCCFGSGECSDCYGEGFV